MNDQASKKHLMRWARGLVVVAVVVGLWLAGRSAVGQWQDQQRAIDGKVQAIERDASIPAGERAERIAVIQSGRPSLANIRWSLVAAAGLIYAIGLVPAAMVLHRALHSLGERPRLTTSIKAQLVGHVGKYVPGKAMVVVIRAGVLARDAVRPVTATISIFLETFLMMAVGAATAGLVTLALPVPAWIRWTALLAAMLATVPTLPPVLRFVSCRIGKVDREQAASAIGLRLFLAGWAWSLMSWVLIGASFAMIVAAIPSPDELPSALLLYAVSTAAISLAIVAGFASLLPGGAGVRELVLTTIMASAVGSTHALVAAVIARVTFLVIEILLAGIGSMGRSDPGRTTDEAESSV